VRLTRAAPVVASGWTARRRSLTTLANHLPDEGAHTAAFFADADADDWARVERVATRRRFSSGEVILHEGDVDRSLLVLLRGRLEFVVGTDVRAVVDAPTLLGEVAFFDPGPRSGTLRARTDGELLQLRFEQFEALAASSPSLARRILLDAGRRMAQRLRHVTDE
jgi:CRP/FNR family cyclic AMP-dependent transcriptional regulator